MAHGVKIIKNKGRGESVGNLVDKILARLYGAFPSLVKRYAKKADILTFTETPFTSPSTPLEKARVALITTGGVHLKSQTPFDMEDRSGDPSYREIPADTSFDELLVTHDYYDNRDAKRDPGVVFPLDALKDLAAEGVVGSVNGRHFSFMGHITGEHLKTLMEGTAPEVARFLREDGVDAVVLAPA
ncbi:MAG: hypothetical protein D6713_04185 [Deltaproteobacteria bacterium]|nr:MAG: hypothetical protein D6713_04185 [Deltaproteobacteria bacterium]